MSRSGLSSPDEFLVNFKVTSGLMLLRKVICLAKNISPAISKHYLINLWGHWITQALLENVLYNGGMFVLVYIIVTTIITTVTESNDVNN